MAKRNTKTQERESIMTNTNYGEVRSAYLALRDLSQQGLQIPLEAALRWKRILGVLRPLVEQLEELQQQTLDQFSMRDEEGKAVQGDQPGTVRLSDPRAFEMALRQMSETTLEVGADKVLVSDFGDTEAMVSSGVVVLLAQLGPFLDEGEDATP